MARILLVEDDEFTAAMVNRVLTDAGHKVLTAADGLQGVAKAAAERPDLIVMDLGLPSMDGWTATRKIKADAKTREIPVIALTSNMTPDDQEEAYNAGCDGFLTKPAAAEILLGRITELPNGSAA